MEMILKRAKSRHTLMAHIAVLTEICALQELKKDTAVTRSVLATVQSLLTIRDESKLRHLAVLMTGLRNSYAAMHEECTAIQTYCHQD